MKLFNGVAVPRDQVPLLSLEALRQKAIEAPKRGQRISALFGTPAGKQIELVDANNKPLDTEKYLQARQSAALQGQDYKRQPPESTARSIRRSAALRDRGLTEQAPKPQDAERCNSSPAPTALPRAPPRRPLS